MSVRICILAVAPTDELSAALATELDELYDLRIVRTLEAALSAACDDVDLVIVPELVGDSTGLTIARDLDALGPGVPVIVVAATPENPELIVAANAGHIAAAVQVPWRRSELAIAAQRALEVASLRAHRTRAQTRTQQRLDALTAMTELSTAISDLGSHAELARVVAQTLFKIVRAGVGAVMLDPDDGSGAHLHIHCHRLVADGVLSRTRDRCIAALATLTNRDIDERGVIVDVTGERASGEADDRDAPVTQVAIHVTGSVAGLILLTAYDEDAYNPSDEKLLYFLAARASEAMRTISRRLHDERRRLSLMVESMADGLILTDTGSDLVLINPAGRAMLGIDHTENVTTLFLKDKLGFYPFDLVATRPTVMGDEKPLREEVRVGERLFHSIVSPVRDGAGKLARNRSRRRRVRSSCCET